MASLTVYLSNAASAVLSTADKLYAVAGTPSTSSATSLLGTSTGWGEVTAQGTTHAWAGSGSIGAPTGKGWFWDVTSLDSQQFVSGTYTATLGLNTAGTGAVTISADLRCRLYKYSSGVYTLVADLSVTGRSITTTATNFAPVTTTGSSSTTFSSGDRLYVDIWANVTANTGASTETLRISSLSTDISGQTGNVNARVITPGYTSGATSQIKDLKARLLLLAASVQDVGLRLRLQPNGIRNLSTRLILKTLPKLDLTTRINLRPPVVSTQDAAVYKTQIVKAYTPAGVFIDVVRDAPLLSGFKETVNTAISPLQVVLPRAFDNFDLAGTGGPGTVAQGNIWQYLIFGPGLPVVGKLRYQGVVDAFQPSIADNGAETVTVTLTPQSSALADHGIGGTQAFVATDPVSLFNWWFNNNDPITGRPYTYPMTLDGTNPASSGVSISYPFINENLASIFVTIIQMLPSNWFIRPNPDLTTTLNITPLTAQHTFHVGQDSALLQYKQDWTQLKNVIYAIGGTPAGYGPETITPVASPGTGNGLYNAVFKNSHTGTWNITVDPSFTIAATGPAITAGTNVVVTPSSMTNIVKNILLRIEMGTGTAETVTVISTTSSTFTATFANSHSGSYIIHLDSSFVVNTTCSTQIGGAPTLSAFVPTSSTNIIAGAKYLVGGGTNLKALTSIATGAPSDLATFGERLLLTTDTRVSDQGSLNTLAQGLLTLLDQVSIRTRVRVVDYRGDTQTGLGFDIETIQVGDSCQIATPTTAANLPASIWNTGIWDSSSWDFAPGAGFGQISVITALTYNFDSVDLEISNLQPNQDAILMKLRNTVQDFTIGTQSQ